MGITKNLLKEGMYEVKDYEGDVLTHTWFEDTDGKKNGLETEYDKETGSIKRTTEWKDGVKHGHEKLYDDEVVTTDCEFLNGTPYKLYEYPKTEDVYDTVYSGSSYYDYGWHDGDYERVRIDQKYILSDEFKRQWAISNVPKLHPGFDKDLCIRRDFKTKEIDAVKYFDYNFSKERFYRKEKGFFVESENTEDEERNNFIKNIETQQAVGKFGSSITVGLAAVGAVVPVAMYIASVYPNKEKAPEDKRVVPQEIKADQSKLSTDEKYMFTLAFLASTTEFESFMNKHKDININATNENGETVLMSLLANGKLKNAEYILDNFGDKIEYKARTNDGTGYQDIMKARLHSPTANGQDIKINRMIKENTQKEEQQIREGKVRTTDSYAFYDAINSRTK